MSNQKSKPPSTGSGGSSSPHASQFQLVDHLSPEGVSPKERLFDCCVFLFCCSHDKLALSMQPKSQVAWLPFVPLSSKQSWHDGALASSFHVLAGSDIGLHEWLKTGSLYKEAQILEVFRLQEPVTGKFTTRIAFGIRFKAMEKIAGIHPRFKCCDGGGRIKWVKLDVLTTDKKFKEPYWGPEMFEFAKWFTDEKMSMTQKIHECPIYQTPVDSVSSDKSYNLEKELLKSASANANDVTNLYAHYIGEIYPSVSMSIWAFKSYVVKFGIELSDNRLRRLFRAFNINQNGYICFRELLMGLASIDPNTANCKARIQLVFRFYNMKNDGLLSKEDFSLMVREIYPTLKEKEFKNKVQELATKFDVYDGRTKNFITFDDLYKMVQQSTFTGTSSLCRLIKPVFAFIANVLATRKLEKRMAQAQVDRLHLVVNKKYYNQTCQRCIKKDKYKLVPHLTKMICTQELVKPKSLRMDSEEKNDLTDEFLQDDNPITQLIQAIRQMHGDHGTCKHPKGVLSNDPKELIKLIEALHFRILDLFTTVNNKCVTASSPCFVIGDIHGNLEDLFSMERVLWRPLPVGANLLFLGDYVDRGMWGVECALYVLALKALFPAKVTLLRGNHEVREVQLKYSFMEECRSKYQDEAEIIFNLINEMFEQMPLSAVLDDAIFCAHGGIPFKATSLRDIVQLPQKLCTEKDSEVFWEIIWSDPIHERDHLALCELLQQDPEEQDGFVRNNKRGAAWYYSAESARRWFAHNQLTHIMRGHEVPPNGFTFHFGDKCVTVFSSSHYQGNNKCAVLFVDQQRIRVLRIDTARNGPPFEKNH